MQVKRTRGVRGVNAETTGPKIYFSDVFGVDREVLENFGAFNIALVNDLPLFGEARPRAVCRVP